MPTFLSILNLKQLIFNPLTPELNPSVQRCLPRFLLGILIFKGLTVRRLYKSFGVKGLKHISVLLARPNTYIETCGHNLVSPCLTAPPIPLFFHSYSALPLCSITAKSCSRYGGELHKESPRSVQRQTPIFVFSLLKSSCLLCSEYYSLIPKGWASIHSFARPRLLIYTSKILII
jgi:hypothetical protein